MRNIRLYRMIRVALVIVAAVFRYSWLRTRNRFRWLRPSQAAWDRAHARTGRAIHRLATGLGGAFVKLGQVFAARADFFPEPFLAPLRGLHDRVPARAFSVLRDHVERELGRPVGEVFATVDDRALAAASLAQVHRARLLTGEDVVIKVQYPEARRLFPTDLSSLRRAVRVLRWMNRSLDLRTLADELAAFIKLELEFRREAASTERARVELMGRSDVHVPRVYADFSSDRVLVLEYLPGRPISDVAGLRADGVDLERLAERVASVYCEMIFDKGFFHGDPHPGNILVRPDGSIGLIDFGLAKELPAGFARGVATMMVRGATGDGPGAVAAARTIGFRVSDDTGRGFLAMIRMLLGDYTGGDKLLDALGAAGIDEVPSHFTLIVRVFLLLNGLSHTLVPGRRIIPGAVLAALAPHVVRAREGAPAPLAASM